MKAIFLDRDGTINIDKGYVGKLADLAYFPDTFSALKILQEKKYSLFLITNQSGVARNYFSISDVELIHQQIQSDMAKNGLAPFLEIKVCYHGPTDNCLCRKPKPTMLNELINKYKIDPKKSYMGGDKLTDAECGKNALTTGVLIRSTEKSSEFRSFVTLTDFAHFVV